MDLTVDMIIEGLSNHIKFKRRLKGISVTFILLVVYLSESFLV